MKYIILLIIVLSSYGTFGQTAEEHYERGKQEERRNNAEAAIKEYTRAITLDPGHIDAYYLLAKLYYDTEQYQAAVAHLDKAIALQPVVDFKIVLLELRGACYLKLRNKDKACPDFIEASQLGYRVKEEYLALCNYQRIKNELVYVNLPDKKNWKIQEQSIKDNQHIFSLVNEKTGERLRLASASGVKNSDLKQLMRDANALVKGQSGATQLSFIEQDLNAKEPWILYSVQNVRNEARDHTESQVWLLIQGINYLHTCVISIEDSAFTEQKKQEMIATFKTAKIVYD